MFKSRSPWLHQLDKNRVSVRLLSDIETDVAIVGAGIAGVSTAFFILKYTDKNVVLIDGSKLAHGATGHNAGHVVAAFERSFKDIEGEFGFDMTAKGYAMIESAWSLIREMYFDASLDISFQEFKGYGAISNLEYLITEFEDSANLKKAGLEPYEFFVSEDAPYLIDIPSEFKGDYKVVPQSVINEVLECRDREYTAYHTYRTGCLNSALFCQEIVNYLLNKYKDRFNLYEYTRIKKVVLHDNEVILDADDHTITANRAVLCTNGFENLEIFNKTGLDIDTRFHHLVNGFVAYMAGYLESQKKASIARYYVDEKQQYDHSKQKFGEPYFYITRRPFEYENDKKHNLVCVGGPEFQLEDRGKYSRDIEYPETAKKEIDEFVKRTLAKDIENEIEYAFLWHGLMGYTPNRIRLVGFEPKNNILMYNLGCNGIGILPSIFGGKRIADLIDGKKFEPSIFDPKRN